MLTFKQYITEVSRSDERAINLVKYLEKRQKTPNRIRQPKVGFDSVRNLHWDEYNSKIRSIPINKIKTLQGTIQPSSVIHHIKNKTKEPIKVVQHGAEYYIQDGNNRTFARKILGLKKIKAQVHQGWKTNSIFNT